MWRGKDKPSDCADVFFPSVVVLLYQNQVIARTVLAANTSRLASSGDGGEKKETHSSTSSSIEKPYSSTKSYRSIRREFYGALKDAPAPPRRPLSELEVLPLRRRVERGNFAESVGTKGKGAVASCAFLDVTGRVQERGRGERGSSGFRPFRCRPLLSPTNLRQPSHSV